MPHVIIKLWPGRSEKEKKDLAQKITAAVKSALSYGDESISVGLEEVSAQAWQKEVYEPDIVNKAATLYKKPGYGSLAS